ncbi:MAG: hypothetical protein JWP35_2532 [Caulobacter sp.]|nr:hypothetical protein [Caulobacter sp.]
MAPLTRHEVASGVRNSVAAAMLGDDGAPPFASPWLPSRGATPEARLFDLIARISSHLSRLSAGQWEVHLDDDDAPMAVVMTSPGDAGVAPVAIDERFIRVGGERLALIMPRVTEKVLDLLAVTLARFFGAPR